MPATIDTPATLQHPSRKECEPLARANHVLKPSNAANKGCGNGYGREHHGARLNRTSVSI
jgi:hypothetical protein